MNNYFFIISTVICNIHVLTLSLLDRGGFNKQATCMSTIHI